MRGYATYLLLLSAMAIASCEREHTTELLTPEYQDSLWVQTNWSQPEGCVSALAIGSDGEIFAGTCSAGIYRSTDQGSTWVETNSGLTNRAITALLTRPPRYVFAATGYGVCRSSDNGESWTSLGLTQAGLLSVAVTRSGVLFVATKASGIFRSRNNGDSWVQLSLPDLYNLGAYVTIAFGEGGTLFIGGDQLFRSSNDGDSWERLDAGSMQFVSSLAVTSDGEVFAGATAGIFVSSDNGVSWARVSDRPGGPLVVYSNGRVFSGSYSYDYVGGVVHSSNGGASWEEFGLGRYNVEALVIDSTGFLFAGTLKNGVFRSRRSTLP